MSEYNIRHETGEAGGRFVIGLGKGAEAELTYSVSGPDKWSADHTGVPAAFEGKGIAGQLVRALVAAAKAADVKIIPRCSYVAAWARRHPDDAALFE